MWNSGREVAKHMTMTPNPSPGEREGLWRIAWRAGTQKAKRKCDSVWSPTW